MILGTCVLEVTVNLLRLKNTHFKVLAAPFKCEVSMLKVMFLSRSPCVSEQESPGLIMLCYLLIYLLKFLLLISILGGYAQLKKVNPLNQGGPNLVKLSNLKTQHFEKISFEV